MKGGGGRVCWRGVMTLPDLRYALQAVRYVQVDCGLWWAYDMCAGCHTNARYIRLHQLMKQQFQIIMYIYAGITLKVITPSIPKCWVFKYVELNNQMYKCFYTLPKDYEKAILLIYF